MDRGAWHAAVHGVTKSQTRLSSWIELNRMAMLCVILRVYGPLCHKTWCCGNISIPAIPTILIAQALFKSLAQWNHFPFFMAEMSLFLTSHISAAVFNGGFHHRVIYYLLPGKSTLDAGYKKKLKMRPLSALQGKRRLQTRPCFSPFKKKQLKSIARK